MISNLAIGLAAAVTLFAAQPTLADNTRTPPGNPCAKGNGNPCNGNNGNAGQQGNAGHGNGNNGETVVVTAPPAMAIPRPAIRDRGVFVTQVGDTNRATAIQSAPTAYARVDQTGNRNVADIDQRGVAIAYVDLRQAGMRNDAVVTQDGSGSGNALFVAQSGTANVVRSSQTASGGAENAAVLAQYGTANTMALAQSGSDNLAQLTQSGDDNAMTASQSGAGNRLIWTQQGNGLSNLAISQTGNMAAQITQSK